MAHTATSFHPRFSLTRAASTLFARLGRAFEAHIEARSRRPQIEALNALSDAELARLGIRRHQIPAYVFRDLMHR